MWLSCLSEKLKAEGERRGSMWECDPVWGVMAKVRRVSLPYRGATQ